MNCRNCDSTLEYLFCDLHTCPPSNAMLSKAELNQPEMFLPLKAYVCEKCKLVQVEEIEKANKLFNNEYTYFSSYSKTWLLHAKDYVEEVSKRLNLNSDSLVVEIASNDGYLLQYFKEANIPVLGIEPTINTAEVAISKGIETLVEFFGSVLAKNRLHKIADLVVGNNVLAHVPDINDFVSGVYLALKDDGIATFEFPHLCSLVKYKQFDTIYHEHFSYLSFSVVNSIFFKHGLKLFDVQKLNTHGGSLRVYACKSENENHQIKNSVVELLNSENTEGVNAMEYYTGFQSKVELIKREFLGFLLSKRREGKKVIGYGAAAKGNTLLNFSGVKGNDLITYVVDASDFKQGKFLPGSRIPVVNESQIRITKPDYIVIFPWNIKDEICKQLEYVREWGCKFVISVPQLIID